MRGWPGLLEIEIEVEARADQLRLVPFDDSGSLLRKHFLQLDGLGVHDLHSSGEDLYILAGPTMVLNGEPRVSKWPAARPLLAANREPLRFEAALLGQRTLFLDVPIGLSVVGFFATLALGAADPSACGRRVRMSAIIGWLVCSLAFAGVGDHPVRCLADDATGELRRGPEVVEQQLAVRAHGAGELLPRQMVTVANGEAMVAEAAQRH